VLTEPFDCAHQITALREAGAQQLDPLRLHYLEVLSARAQVQPGRVRSILEEKLTRALAEFRWRLGQEQVRIQTAAVVLIAPEGGAAPRGESLGDVVRSMAQPAPENGRAGWQEPVATGPELNSVRLFRNTWSKLSADKQLNAALDLAPKNAGPINSHMLVLRSLALMREISPDYLSRFISYVDTLVHLEQTDISKPAVPRIATEGEGGKKPKVRRARPR
jgi:hypothetical protein